MSTSIDKGAQHARLIQPLITSTLDCTESSQFSILCTQDTANLINQYHLSAHWGLI